MIRKVEESVRMLGPVLREGKLIIFVGSGISVPSGLPTWDELLKKFVEFCYKIQPYLPAEERFTDLLEDAKKTMDRYPARVASVLRNELIQHESGPDINGLFKEWFVRTMTGKYNRCHELIVGTNYPFILTSNYDMLLEDAADALGLLRLRGQSLTFPETEKIAAAIYKKDPSIIHIHGKVLDILLDQIVFTAEDYQKIESSFPGFKLALQYMLLTYSILFVGYGASDPHLEQLVDEVAYYMGWSKSTILPHYYLALKHDKIGAVLARHKELSRTQIIELSSYDEVATLLEALRDIAPRLPEVDG